MSRNHTHYSIVRYSNDEPPELLFYADCRTIKRARKIAAANPMTVINRWHHTPSSHKSLFDKSYRQTRGLLRLQRCYRKLRRKEADAKKREERIKKREAAERVADVMERFWESWDTWQGGTIP